MKKVLLGLMIVASLFVITGCGSSKQSEEKDGSQNLKNEEKVNETKNSLSCKGKVSFLTDFHVIKPITADKPNPSDNPEEWSLGFPGKDYDNDDLDNSELIFIFDKNNDLSVKGKETYTKSFSSQVSDEDLKEMNGEIDGATYKSYKKDGKVTIEYTLGSNFELIRALNVDYKNKKDLKEVLEEKTLLVCNDVK